MFQRIVSVPPCYRRISRCSVIHRSIGVAAEGIEAGLRQVVLFLDDVAKSGRTLRSLLRLTRMTESLGEVCERKAGLFVHSCEIELLLWLWDPGLHPASTRAVVVDAVGGVMRGLVCPGEHQFLPMAAQERLVTADLEVVVHRHLEQRFRVGGRELVRYGLPVDQVSCL